MKSFFDRISYSLGNEDWATEKKALQTKPHHRVLCVTASGDRPLHLLADTCDEMTAIDLNPVQNYLLELKIAALKQLDYAEYLGFLGLQPHHQRKHTLNFLSTHMTPQAADYWRRNGKIIEKGIIYQGALERWSNRASTLIRLFRKREIRDLFKCNSLEEQIAFVKHKWNHALWEKALNLAMHPWITSKFFKDPGMYANFSPSIKPGSYTYQRMINCLNHHLAKENPLISFIFNGKIEPQAYPPYLKQEGIEKIKQNLNRLSIKTMDVVEYLEKAPEQSIDRFSLSDVVSYLDYSSFKRLMQGIIRTAKPGARFCLRQFISRYEIPSELNHDIKREHELEKLLEKEDRAFVYHFTIGTVTKN